jgi:hypothetical protein
VSAPAAALCERGWFWPVAVAAAVVAVCSSTALVVRARSRRRRDDVPASSRWATIDDVERLACEFPAPRWPLGESARGVRLGAPSYTSLSAVSPSRSATTDSLVVPAALQFDGSLVVVASTPDVMLLTGACRARVGPVYVFDPTQSAVSGSACWSPLRSSRGSYTAARTTARVFVDAVVAEDASPAPFRCGHCVDVLAAALRAADVAGAGLSSVHGWLVDESSNRVGRVLEVAGEWRALHDWNAVRALPDVARREAFAVGLELFGTFTDPDVQARLDVGRLDDAAAMFDPEAMLESGDAWTLYVISTSRRAHRLRPVVDVLVGSIVRAGYDRFLDTGRPLDPQLGVILDGTGFITAPANLGTIASCYADAGVPVMSIWPDPRPGFAGYEREQARSIRSSHDHQIVVGSACDDRESERFRELFGGPVLDPVPGTAAAIVLSSSLAPATVRLRPWNDDTDLVALASTRVEGPTLRSDGGFADRAPRA